MRRTRRKQQLLADVAIVVVESGGSPPGTAYRAKPRASGVVAGRRHSARSLLCAGGRSASASLRATAPTSGAWACPWRDNRHEGRHVDRGDSANRIHDTLHGQGAVTAILGARDQRRPFPRDARGDKHRGRVHVMLCRLTEWASSPFGSAASPLAMTGWAQPPARMARLACSRLRLPHLEPTTQKAANWGIHPPGQHRRTMRPGVLQGPEIAGSAARGRRASNFAEVSTKGPGSGL